MHHDQELPPFLGLMISEVENVSITHSGVLYEAHLEFSVAITEDA